MKVNSTANITISNSSRRKETTANSRPNERNKPPPPPIRFLPLLQHQQQPQPRRLQLSR
ncbi:hypothetical protein Goklo_003115, partial [Gossypium klotzschianum]|nr:hypothetical protein [Gossypium klotzschianum]